MKRNTFNLSVQNGDRIKETKMPDLESFCQAIVDASSVPRPKRADLNQVNVVGNIRELGNNYFLFNAHFDRRYSGQDNQVTDRLTLSLPYSHEPSDGKYDENEYVHNYLENIKRGVIGIKRDLNAEVRDGQLVVDSAFYTLSRLVEDIK